MAKKHTPRPIQRKNARASSTPGLPQLGEPELYTGKTKKDVMAAVARGDWTSVMQCYWNPCENVEAFNRHAHEMDDISYWSILGELYRFQRFTGTHREHFRAWFRSPRPCREHLMEEDDQSTFARLPDLLTLYRGFAHGDGQGISWTLDRRVADWFAYSGKLRAGNPQVLSGEASRADAWAFFSGREVEILIEPDKVRNQKSAAATVMSKQIALVEYISSPFDVSTLFLS
jgi:hypothetical protein